MPPLPSKPKGPALIPQALVLTALATAACSSQPPRIGQEEIHVPPRIGQEQIEEIEEEPEPGPAGLSAIDFEPAQAA